MGHLKLVLVTAFTTLALTACTPAARAVVGEAVTTIEESENSKARVLIKAPCAITIGAKNRTLSEAEARHVEGLCGGSTDQPLTIEDVRAIMSLMNEQ